MKKIVLILIAVIVALTSAASLSNEMYKVFRLGKPLILDQDRTIINGRIESGRSETRLSATAPEDLIRQAEQATVRITALAEIGRSAYTGGSGVNISPEGLIITGAHVVQGAENISVTFLNGRQYNAALKALVPDKDLAVLTLNGPKVALPAISLGDSLDVRVGDEITVIGYPLGDFTVTFGTVNRLRVPMVPDKYSIPLMQIYANTIKGNSGGPVLDRDGRVIGIIVGTFEPEEESQRNFLGAVVPINEAKPYLE